MIGPDTFSGLAPVLLGSSTKEMVMSPSSTVHCGQDETKYVTFKLLMHAAFVVDEIWGFLPEPARTGVPGGLYMSRFAETAKEGSV